ncbi:MAG: tRNA (adenosine(37)-N6)-threonylcarbamoyltransferase complex transferase subunit TsaD [Chlamydiota bacterium]|nr:tRNA (adenosine(37)-N6)-threonylcarbamoyltransferase complex transferase subunit TsaD [Chlamydiota bacterium]
MMVLGIETSCDETAASVVENQNTILSSIISSQIQMHQPFGGVVPELASRRHVEVIDAIVHQAISEAGVTKEDIDLLAVTEGPGLIGSLLVGVTFAKAMAFAWGKRLVGVDHLEAHLFASKMENPRITFPYLSLIVSGGHTLLVLVKEVGDYDVLGSTIDDAAGEAFDKVARILGLGYPGGPVIDRMSKQGDPRAIVFPRPLIHQNNFNFSFSGLKTAVLYCLRGYGAKSKEISEWEKEKKADLVASFQEAVVDVLIHKALRAAEKHDLKQIAVGGGVGANSRLREKFCDIAASRGLEVFFPSLKMCTDNAAMIAGLACAKEKAGLYQEKKTLRAYPNANFLEGKKRKKTWKKHG